MFKTIAIMYLSFVGVSWFFNGVSKNYLIAVERKVAKNKGENIRVYKQEFVWKETIRNFKKALKLIIEEL